MLKVDRQNLREHEHFKFSSEASTLGWPPGPWPKAFSVDGLGNGQPFTLVTFDDEGANYAQELGCLNVTVFND